MTKTNEIEVALTKRVCFVCGKEIDGVIIMNTRLSKSQAEQVKELHNKVVGFTEEPCDECKSNMKLGFILIGYIEEKTDDMNNPFRSGHQWVISKEAANRMFNPNLLEKGFAFIDIKLAEQIGLSKS